MGDKTVLVVLVIEIPPQRQPVTRSEGVFPRRTLGGNGNPPVCRWTAMLCSRFKPTGGCSTPRCKSFPTRLGSISIRWSPSASGTLGVVDANGAVRGVQLAALLLFGQEEALPLRAQPRGRLPGVARIGRRGNDFFRGPLLRVMEEIEARIRAHNREEELMVGLLRVGVPDYPERALREALPSP